MIDCTISHYRIIKELGVGGMGVLYEAGKTDEAVRCIQRANEPSGDTDNDVARKLGGFVHASRGERNKILTGDPAISC